MRECAAVLLLLVLLSACGGHSSVKPKAVAKSVEQQRVEMAVAREKAYDEVPNVAYQAFFSPRLSKLVQDGILTRNEAANINQFTYATLYIDGTAIGISSLSPRILNQVSGFDTKSVSAVRFSDDKRHLVFFTRNPETGKGYRAMLPVNRINSGAEFAFPILTAANTIEVKAIEISDIEIKPAAPNPLASFQYTGQYSGRM